MEKHELTGRLMKDLAYSLYASGQAYGDKISFNTMISDYPSDIFKKIVLIHSGYAFFARHLLDAAGGGKSKPLSKRPDVYLLLKNECYHTFHIWRVLGLGEEDMKEMLNKLAKIRIRSEEGKLGDKLEELTIVLKNARYSPEILSPEVVNYLTDLTAGGPSEGANIRDFLNVLDIFGEDGIEIDKKVQKNLLEGVKSYTKEDGSWSPRTASRIYEFLEKRGGLDTERKVLKEKIEKYVSEKGKSKRLKRKIQKMTKSLK
jgi:hypothetical protein